MKELALQLQEMKLNEILLKDELESTKNSNATADSLKRAEQRNRIDSLRALTPGVPVVVEGDSETGIIVHSRNYHPIFPV